MNQKKKCPAALRGKIEMAEWLSDNELRITLRLEEASVWVLKGGAS